ncbi:SurA N-terminal domain-containing protein [Candidatus Accumulibacter contiguus]|uniref:SurA N-terminal domain-containing protein n=1 Tax=Candidatus Accumulibacter contiguus TaxID=2954381 RepID=UPI00207BDB3A|nr:SurA N-terminal domain-containing protein [Candidatus Accumulibacter contiguus]
MFFDAVRNNKRVVQIFLALITLPFAFWGVDSYVRNTGAGADLASVGDSKITMPQFDQAVGELSRTACGRCWVPVFVQS